MARAPSPRSDDGRRSVGQNLGERAIGAAVAHPAPEKRVRPSLATSRQA